MTESKKQLKTFLLQDNHYLDKTPRRYVFTPLFNLVSYYFIEFLLVLLQTSCPFDVYTVIRRREICLF